MIISYNGNTCVQKENLKEFVKQLIDINIDAIEECIINLKTKDEIKIEKRNEEEWVYLPPFYRAEENIALKLIKLQQSKNVKKVKNFDTELLKIENGSEIILSEKQKEALKKINDNNVCIITGGPGTGKTTIIKNIIEMYQIQKYKVALCAPTGRAAKRITETTAQEAKTLHRLLEIGKIEEEGKIDSIDYEVAPIDADIIIVDEVSMVDVFLMNYLLNAIYLGTKLVLVGDIDQLPSVGPGNILKDIIQSEVIPTTHLDKVFRQAAKSKIIVNAHKVNKGESFLHSQYEQDAKPDFFYIRELVQEKILQQIISLCTGRLEKYGNYDFFKNIQVLTPTKKGMLGTKELNQVLQQALNPQNENKKEKNSAGVTFREGDKIMQIKNNYDMFWEKRTPEYESGSGVYNGELGIIEKINEAEKQVKIHFDDDKIVWYTYSDLEQIEHAYAITVHKAQRK